MNNKEQYNMVNKAKTIDAIKLNGKYVDSELVKNRIACTVSVTTLVGALAAIGGFILF